MQQLFFVKKGKLEWREVSNPNITSSKQAIVRPFAVAKCDLDDAFLFNNIELKLKIGSALGLIDPMYKHTFGDLLKGPFPFGHECVAEVITIGEDVNHIRIGDVVSVPFQISCGHCYHCAKGFSSVCSNTPPISTYGFGKHLTFGGAMSENLLVPFADAMLLKIPENINPIHLASLSDNIPDAYRHVKELETDPNQKVLIINGKAKSVGLYSLLLAKALKVAQIDYVDSDKQRLDIASNLKANHVYESYGQVGSQYDLVIDTSSSKRGLNLALKAVRNFGTISSSGIHIKKTPLSLIEMYTKGVNFKIGFANARTEAERILQLMDDTQIPFELVTSHEDVWENAESAFMVETTKVIVKRDRLTISSDAVADKKL